MFRKIRITSAITFFVLITLLFLDFTGAAHHWFGWMAGIQFLPALIALNTVVLLGLVAMTLLLGRIYCSVVCPLGVFQDIASRIAGKRKKNRFTYSPALRGLRYGALTLFIAASLAGAGPLVAPYSAYGRIASNLFAPVYLWGNNILAYFAEQADSYAFYSVDVWIKSTTVFFVAAITFTLLTILAWRNGRSYCNTVCPVGTILGFIARFSFFKPVLDAGKCNGCGLCARNCKASCIDSETHKIDYSRCITCMNCIEKCRTGALKYTHRQTVRKTVSDNTRTNAVTKKQIDNARRGFLSATALFAATTVIKAQEKRVDGGLAVIEDKKIPRRGTPVIPAGSISARNFTQHCTACQLCVSVCPNQVLRPSTDLMTLMQPEMSYERGYCRPECTRCSDVCPTGAIQAVTPAEKSAVQIGHAIWIKDNCVVNTDGVDCGNCARHCPVGAIQMIETNPGISDSSRIPVINTERCIGCGACENLCPSRPFSAIYVEGHRIHRIV